MRYHNFGMPLFRQTWVGFTIFPTQRALDKKPNNHAKGTKWHWRPRFASKLGGFIVYWGRASFQVGR